MTPREKIIERDKTRKKLESEGYFIRADNVYEEEPDTTENICRFIISIGKLEQFITNPNYKK